MALTVATILGLFFVLLGERLLGDSTAIRLALSGAGAAIAFGATAWRALVWTRERGERRGVEGWLLGAQSVGLLGLAIYACSDPLIIDKLKLTFSDTAARGRYRDALTALWPILVGGSLLALVFGERAYAPMRQAKIVEARRVRVSTAVGLEIAVAAAFLAFVGFVASERDIKLDMSYFRTSKPSGSTAEIAKSFTEPLKMVLFFPDVNEVRADVEAYARDLVHMASGRVQMESYDRFAQPKLAEQYRVSKDGTLVLASGERKETIPLGTEIDSARSKLRTLDREVQKSLLKIAREKRTVYLTSGHGELADPQPPDLVLERPPVAMFKKLLEGANLTVKSLGTAQGLGNVVPDDAAAVFVLGPTAPLLQEELEALGRYLERGGRVLMALDTERAVDVGGLLKPLGLAFQPTPLAHERAFVPRRRNDSDHLVIATNRFSSHASVTTLSRHSSQLGVVLVAPGALDKADGTATGKDAPKIDFVVKSMPETFADANGNFVFDAASEKQAIYNLAAAVSKKVPATADGKNKDDKPELRAFVVTDADVFGDAALTNVLGNLYLAADAVRWVIGEEKFAGEVASTEEDIKIEHTHQKDILWFYGTIFGMPALVLGGGFGYTWRVRRRKGKVAS